MSPFLGERCEERRLHRQKTTPVIVASSDTRLIGHEYHWYSRLIATTDRLASFGPHPDVLRASKIICVLDDNSVTVEKHGGSSSIVPAGDVTPKAYSVDKRHCMLNALPIDRNLLPTRLVHLQKRLTKLRIWERPHQSLQAQRRTNNASRFVIAKK